jgi:methionine-S-sulfoxide reductase
VFAGGCFWGVQGVFQRVKGVSNAVSGYAGGDAKTARYDEVGSGRTGHAESVRITYDPQQVSYGKLLQIYFSVAHDPTELNRQGPDTGTQYRSTVFAENAEQARIAKDYIAQLNQAKTFGKPLATTIEMAKPFYAAEDYHQDYLTLRFEEPEPALHRDQRHAEDRRPEEAVPGELQGDAVAGARPAKAVISLHLARRPPSPPQLWARSPFPPTSRSTCWVAAQPPRARA